MNIKIIQKMKKLLTLSLTLVVLAIFAEISVAQTPPMCGFEVTEGDLFAGGPDSFVVTGPPPAGTPITIDSINSGTGTQSITVVGVPENVVINIPPFTPGTYNPVVVTYTPIDPNQPIHFRLRAANAFHAIFIDVWCSLCPLQLRSTVTAGINDNLAPPFEATTKSPQLALIFPNTKDFDDPAVNRIFAHSFLLRRYKPCGSEACRATLLVRVCNSGASAWQNDILYVGSAANGTFTPSIFVRNIWNSGESNQCKNVAIPINTTTLNSLVNLDVVMQDDSSIDYMQLDWDF